jgi:hypothetical protein
MRFFRRILLLLPVCLLAQDAPVNHDVRPGDDPQAVLEAARAGDKLTFLPGLHQHPLGKYQSILYVDKPIDIELMAGAVLKLQDKQTVLDPNAELTTDHGVRKKLDDINIGGKYDLGLGPVILTVRIDGEGTGGSADSFSWGVGVQPGRMNEKVPITGGWQSLTNGIQIRFGKTTGHNAGSLWFLSYDGRESYGIRVGRGLQEKYIDGVRIHGTGTIDLNSQNNVQPSIMVKDISACVLVHGRVRNVWIEGITMANSMRSVMLYGEHTGKFLAGGGTAPGESFDAENISILYTRTINPDGQAYLLGHPSHRGRLSKVRCNFNYMETKLTALEPNFNLDQYEVIGNVIKSGGEAIHCWRKSTHGLIKDNVRIDDNSGMRVVLVGAPGGWEVPANLIIRDNINHLSGKTGLYANVSGGFENRAPGQYASVVGGSRNAAEGLGSVVTGGSLNEAGADYSRVNGLGARSTRPGEDVIASGSFFTPGDAQTSVVVAKQVTNDDQYRALRLANDVPLAIPENASVTYRILIVARSAGGGEQGAFEATGLAQNAGGDLKVFGGKVTAIHKSDAGLDLRIAVNAQTGSLDVEGRGLKNKIIRWVARIELAEVQF